MAAFRQIKLSLGLFWEKRRWRRESILWQPAQQRIKGQYSHNLNSVIFLLLHINVSITDIRSYKSAIIDSNRGSQRWPRPVDITAQAFAEKICNLSSAYSVNSDVTCHPRSIRHTHTHIYIYTYIYSGTSAHQRPCSRTIRFTNKFSEQKTSRMTNGVSDYEHASWQQRQADSIGAGVSVAG
jgi:hypothetical protein